MGRGGESSVLGAFRHLQISSVQASSCGQVRISSGQLTTTYLLKSSCKHLCQIPSAFETNIEINRGKAPSALRGQEGDSFSCDSQKKSSSCSDNKDGGHVHIFVVSTKFLFMIAQQSCLSRSVMGRVALSNVDIL